MSYENLLTRAEMMLTFGMSKEQTFQRLAIDEEDYSLIYFAIIGAEILMKDRSAE